MVKDRNLLAHRARSAFALWGFFVDWLCGYEIGSLGMEGQAEPYAQVEVSNYVDH